MTEWHEGPPPVDGWYIVWSKSINIYAGLPPWYAYSMNICRYNEGLGWNCWGVLCYPCKVVKWMPMPEPPKDREYQQITLDEIMEVKDD